MIDYLRRYVSEEEAKADALVAPFLLGGEWDTARVIPAVRVYTLGEEITNVYGNTYHVRIFLPYWYLWVSLPTVEQELVATSVIVADRRQWELEGEYIIHSLIPAEDFPSYYADNTMAGAGYPFGQVL